MAMHVFVLSDENYQVCINRGLVGLPETDNNSVFDALASRITGFKENDYVCLYITKTKELRGIWQIEGKPFFDATPVWTDKVYPIRCKIKSSDYNFKNPLRLDDIRDFENNGRGLQRGLQLVDRTLLSSPNLSRYLYHTLFMIIMF